MDAIQKTNLLKLSSSLIKNGITHTIKGNEIIISGFPSFTKFVKEYEVDDYPYGKFRTKAKWFVEKKGGKERVGRTTIDPKNGRANKPKYTTFASSAIIGLGSDKKVYPITGDPGQISVMQGDMKYSAGSLFPKDKQYDEVAKALGFKKAGKVEVKMTPKGAEVHNLYEFTLKQLLELCGIGADQIGLVKNVMRKNKITHEEFTVNWKDSSKKPFIINLHQ